MANWRNDGRMANNDRTTRPYTSRAMNTTPADDGIRIGCEDRHRQANHEARERIFHFAAPKDGLAKARVACHKHSSRSVRQANERACCQSMQIGCGITDS
jgi:hypothetical protein